MKRCRGGAGLGPRQRQQLLDQPRRAFDAGGQRIGRGGTFVFAAGALEQLQLQLQRGQRRAQLVRRVGDEGALRVQRQAQALQQRVQRRHQRRHLVGQANGGQRFERLLVALAHARGDALQWAQRQRRRATRPPPP